MLQVKTIVTLVTIGFLLLGCSSLKVPELRPFVKLDPPSRPIRSSVLIRPVIQLEDPVPRVDFQVGDPPGSTADMDYHKLGDLTPKLVAGVSPYINQTFTSNTIGSKKADYEITVFINSYDPQTISKESNWVFLILWGGEDSLLRMRVPVTGFLSKVSTGEILASARLTAVLDLKHDTHHFHLIKFGETPEGSIAETTGLAVSEIGAKLANSIVAIEEAGSGEQLR